MKTIIMAAMLCVGTSAMAQEAVRKDKANIDSLINRDVRHLKERLALTDEQAEKVKKVHADYQKALAELRDKREAEMNKILTDEQKAKLKERKGNRGHNHHKGHPGDRK